jgi:glycosyltransferase involved in cell wall biosynthesis
VVPTGPSGYILSKLFKIPNVLSIHGGDIYDPSKRLSPHNSRILKKAVRIMINNASEAVAQSYNTKSNAEKYYRPDKKIQVIPLGFEQPTFKRVKRETLGMEKDTFYLISIGRLIKRKGYEYLISALKDTDLDVKLLLIGDGPLENDLKKFSRELNIQDKIEFLGSVSEEKKFRYLSLADLYVLSSLHEGYGIVLQEAMYCSLPIVSTNNGGQTDFLKDGINALLVPIEDSKALSLAIQKLKRDYMLREGMKQHNTRDIENFSIDKIAGEYEKLFEKEVVEVTFVSNTKIYRNSGK